MTEKIHNLKKGAANMVLILITIFSLGVLINAQTNKTVKDSGNGYSFSVPNDWINQEANGGYVLTNKAQTANIVVKPHFYKSYADFTKGDGAYGRDGYTRLANTQDLGDGIFYDRVTKEINGKKLIFEVVFLTSSKDGGLIMLGVSTYAESTKSVLGGMMDLVKSLKFFPSMKSPRDTELRNAFAGKKLTYSKSFGGYSEVRIISLCKSGTYQSQTRASSMSAVDFGSTTEEDGDNKIYGTWEVKYVGESMYLILHPQRGESLQYLITGQSNNAVGLNGIRYVIGGNDQCN
jgi:hypothetical protein